MAIVSPPKLKPTIVTCTSMSEGWALPAVITVGIITSRMINSPGLKARGGRAALSAIVCVKGKRREDPLGVG